MKHAAQSSRNEYATTTPTDESRWNEVWRRLDNLERLVIMGNGKPSLVERVATIERGMATQTWLLRAVLGVALSNLAALVALAVRVALRNAA